MPRPARPIEPDEAADIIAADAMLTLADTQLREALRLMASLRRRGVPVRQLAERLGLSERACRMDGTGPVEAAAERLTASRHRGTDRRPSRREAEQYMGSRTDS